MIHADDCLWYGLPDGIEANLVIVEAKAKELSSSGETQLLTYMSMVHLARVQIEKVNRVVYGLTRIGQNGEVRRTAFINYDFHT